MADSTLVPVFGQSCDGFSYGEAGAQLHRLCEVGIHGRRKSLGSARFAIEVPSVAWLGESFWLYTAREVSAVLAAVCHLPIPAPRRRNDTPLRSAFRRRQLVLLHGGE